MIAIGADIQTDMLTRRGLNQALRFTNRLEMLEHKAHVLPLHFQNVPQTRPGGAWGYAKRDKEYMKRKARTHRHQRPNVFGGELERAVLQTARVTATAKGSRLIARGSTKTPLTNDRRIEIEAVSTTDANARRKSWRDTFVEVAQQPQYRKKTRKRAGTGRFA